MFYFQIDLHLDFEDLCIGSDLCGPSLEFMNEENGEVPPFNTGRSSLLGFGKNDTFLQMFQMYLHLHFEDLRF